MKVRSGIIAALLMWVAVPSIAAAADSWRMVTMPHFRVLSQVNDHQTGRWIRDYEQFIAATSEAVGIKPRALPPLTIILFANDRAFTPYKLMRPDGKAARVAGQFVTLGGTSTIGLAIGSEHVDTRRTIFHEATHWLMSVDPGRQPTWFSEGIAEMLSTFEQSGTKVSWAKPIESHLLQLQQTGLMPLQEFLTRTDALQDQDRHDDRYYAQSWALVHFLMRSSDPALPELLSRYLTLYKDNTPEETVRQVFGDTLVGIERELNQYVRKTSFRGFTLPATQVVDPPPSVPAPRGVVEGALAFMALGVGRHEPAQQHAARAVHLAPDLPGGHEVLAYLANDRQDNAAVGRHADAAIRAGSRDFHIYLLMANAVASNDDEDRGAVGSARIALYRKAIELSPTRRQPYQLLAGDLLFADQPQREDLLWLEQGQRRFPSDDWLRVGIAAVKARLDGSGEALPAIQAALRPESSLSAEQRRAIAILQRNLQRRAMDAELNAASERRDAAGARAIIARYLESLGDDPQVVEYLKRRDAQLEMAQLVEKVNLAMREGRTAELNTLFDQILAHPAVTPELRNLVDSTRRRMR